MIWKQLNLSEDMNNILNELVKRKVKLDRYKFWKLFFTVSAMVWMAVFFYYFYRYILMPSGKNMLFILNLFSDTRVLFSICASGGSFLLMTAFTEQYNKQKAKYDSLRAETIELFLDPWDVTKIAAFRDIISKDLKDNYDINISYKT